MSQQTQAEIEKEDGFIRGFNGIPDDQVLRAKSDIALYDALASATPGTTAYMVIEAEKRRRESTTTHQAQPAPNVKNFADNKSRKEPYEWNEKPLGIIGVTVIGGVFTVLVVYLLKIYFGLPL